jgi:hypothetical protein
VYTRTEHFGEDTHATIDLNLKIQKMEENAARQAARLVWEENSEHAREAVKVPLQHDDLALNIVSSELHPFLFMPF